MSKFGDIDLKLGEFAPFFSFWTGHSQTILGHIIPSVEIDFDLETEILTLPDGDQMLVEYFRGVAPFTLSIYHGLGGNARADYMQRSAMVARELGWNIVLVNHRAASPLAQSKKSYHSGRGEDASHVIHWCREKFPDTKQVAVGFSMSGSILLNLVSGRFGTELPDYAIVVNAPLDLKSAAWNLRRGFSKIYDYRFYFNLKKIILSRHPMKLPRIARTVDLDELYTAPVNQFKNRDDYYEKCSTKTVLNRIKTKTFILTAKDDPFIDVKDYLNGAWNSQTHVTIANHGGHMGYYAADSHPRYGRRWLDRYLNAVFQAILGDVGNPI